MLFNTIGVSITNKCPVSCKICCYNCRIENNSVMEHDLVEDLITQAVSSQQIHEFVISGGEPFLFLSELENIYIWQQKVDYL